MAAKPRIQGMIRDAVWAGLLPGQILEAGLSEVIEAATFAHPSELDSDEQATAKLYSQKLPRRQTKPGSKPSRDCRDRVPQTRPPHPWNAPAPPPKRRTPMTWTSQRRAGRAVSVGRSSKRSFHGSLIRLVSGT